MRLVVWLLCGFRTRVPQWLWCLSQGFCLTSSASGCTPWPMITATNCHWTNVPNSTRNAEKTLWSMNAFSQTHLKVWTRMKRNTFGEGSSRSVSGGNQIFQVGFSFILIYTQGQIKEEEGPSSPPVFLDPYILTVLISPSTVLFLPFHYPLRFEACIAYQVSAVWCKVPLNSSYGT